MVTTGSNHTDSHAMKHTFQKCDAGMQKPSLTDRHPKACCYPHTGNSTSKKWLVSPPSLFLCHSSHDPGEHIEIFGCQG